MPSIDAPSYYERSRGDAAVTHAQMAFAKHLLSDVDNGVEDCGTTESPLGFVMLCHVTFADIVEYLPSDSTLADLATLGIEPGWYIVKTDDNGLVWAMYYGQGTHGEEQARADWAECEAVDHAWNLAEDQCYDEPEPDMYWSGTGELMSDDSYIDYLNR